MIEYSEGRGRPPQPTKRSEIKRKTVKILNLFSLYFVNYMTKKGRPEAYIPTTREIYLCEMAAGLPYNIRQWEKFISTYFRYLDELLEESEGKPSLTHFLDNFSKISHLCGV